MPHVSLFFMNSEQTYVKKVPRSIIRPAETKANLFGHKDLEYGGQLGRSAGKRKEERVKGCFFRIGEYDEMSSIFLPRF
jgi:hypothetical protein